MSYPKIMDAAVPPATAPPGIDGVMGYIGGPRATRVWTLADWLRFQHLRQFPVYVPDLGTDPMTQAADAVALAENRGWAARMAQPGNRVIVIDMEAESDRGWYATMARYITSGGFTPACYGSLSTVLDNAAELVIAADWIGGASTPAVLAGESIEGLQWEANVPVGGTLVDYSVFTPELFARGGVGPRHGA